MLAPGHERDPIQFIDVRDLTQFTVACVEQGLAGRFNVCNTPRAVSIGDLLTTSKRISKADTSFRWADQAFLSQNGLLESGEIPIWAPTQGEYAGAALVSNERARTHGLSLRDVTTTVSDTLAWHRTRPAEQQQKLRAGLAPEREAELLKKLKA